jgi:transcription initiation factor TFIID TATA-box-binding protein
MDEARLAVLQACVMIKRVGYSQAIVRSFCVQNIASAFRYSQTQLNLEELFREYPAQTSYEPELFPALVFRPRVKGVVFLVFESGRVVITGSRSQKAVVHAHAMMVDILDRLTGAKRRRV